MSWPKLGTGDRDVFVVAAAFATVGVAFAGTGFAGVRGLAEGNGVAFIVTGGAFVVLPRFTVAGLAVPPSRNGAGILPL